jgi:hypothetical protein
MATEGVTLDFTDDAIDALADLAARSTDGREHRRPAPADGDGGKRDA